MMTDSGDIMQNIFEAQFLASRNQVAPDLATRLSLLEKLKNMVLDNADAIAKAISDDFGGRARAETELLEILPSIHGIKYTMGKLKNWMKPQRRAVDLMFQPASSQIRYEPLGVIGIISPWNYPLFLLVGPLTDALAAGNRAMIKPSEQTPIFSELFAKLIDKTFDPLEVSVINGGVDVARAFSELPFDHIIFTGSTNVGREVMKAAANNLTPVTLELGGKSPVIIDDDYEIEKAANSVAFGKFLNAGQTCIAPDYVLVPAAKAEEFCKKVIKRANQSYKKPTSNEQYSAICGERHRTRLWGAIEEARATGAKIYNHKAETTEGAKITPTVILGAPNNCLIMREEIFGPILPVVPYTIIEDALAFVRERPRPLALYIFSNNNDFQETILKGAISGGVTINGTLMHVAQSALPFGGIGPSGTGAYHGFEGFKRFSHARSIHKIGFINAFEMLGPPWGALSKLAGKLFAGIK